MSNIITRGELFREYLTFGTDIEFAKVLTLRRSLLRALLDEYGVVAARADIAIAIDPPTRASALYRFGKRSVVAHDEDRTFSGAVRR